MSKHSKMSHTTQKASNVRKHAAPLNQRLPNISNNSFDESISSIEDSGGSYTNPSTFSKPAELPRVDEIFEEPNIYKIRKRDLNAEVFEEYDRDRDQNRNARRRRYTRNYPQRGSSSDNDDMSDSSSISDLSVPNVERDRDRYRGRAKVRLRKAIKNKDWERASSVAKSLQSDDEGSRFSTRVSQKVLYKYGSSFASTCI